MKRKNKTIKITGLINEMRLVMIVVDDLWKTYRQEAVITAGTEAFDGNDFIHSVGSYHPFGKALDFRTRYFSDSVVDKIAKQLRDLLGKDYDVVIHKSHIHIEYDPK